MVVLFTVRLSIPLKEVPGPDLLLAVGADEVFWVPRLPHGSHDLKREAECGSRPWPAIGDLPSGAKVPVPTCRPLPCRAPITCPAMGFLQAPQTPLATVATPSLFRSDCRLPSMLSSWLPGLGGPPGGELLPVFPWAMNYGERGQVRSPRAWEWCLTAPGAFLPQGRWANGGEKGHLLQGPQEPELGIHRHPRWSEGLTAPHWPDQGPGNMVSRMLSPRPWH